ncbi:MAG: hypothetical protein DMG38_21215 [Acidobacteria bacterium]|nr:MAG: hypothetical protein DMG38_21215 [Acidobacteriota bacterium]
MSRVPERTLEALCFLKESSQEAVGLWKSLSKTLTKVRDSKFSIVDGTTSILHPASVFVVDHKEAYDLPISMEIS